MNKKKQIEEMALTEVDILANDINQHCADLKENYCGGTNCLTCLAHALTDKGYRKASEVAIEVIDKAVKIAKEIADNCGELAVLEENAIKRISAKSEQVGALLVLEAISELKKKYTEEGK